MQFESNRFSVDILAPASTAFFNAISASFADLKNIEFKNATNFPVIQIGDWPVFSSPHDSLAKIFLIQLSNEA